MTTNTNTQAHGGGVEAVREAARQLLDHLMLYDFDERHPSGQLYERTTALEYALAASPAAPAAKDDRPDGWSEALAVAFMADNGHNPEMGMFAKSFNEGAWAEINEEWPEFVAFAERRLSPAPDAKGER